MKWARRVQSILALWTPHYNGYPPKRTVAKYRSKINYRCLTETHSRYYGLSLMRTLTRGPYSVRWKRCWLYWLLFPYCQSASYSCQHVTLCDTYEVSLSGGSRPSYKEGGGHPDPEIRGGGLVSKKKEFAAPRASVWSRHRGVGPLGSFPGSATDTREFAYWSYWQLR